MTVFQYRRISKNFINELNDKRLSGESSILFGPRYVGKRYLLQRLSELCEADRENDTGPVVQLRFLAEPAVTRESDVQQIICEAVTAAGMKVSSKKPQGDIFFGPIDKLYERVGKPINLLAANVDAISPHLSRYFLEGIRNRIQKGYLVAVISGEDDLHDLVHSPRGEFFDFAHRYVVQDYEREEFYDYLSNYTQSMCIAFESPPEAYQYLWELTGGNIYSMRMLLWSLIELRAHSEVSANKLFKISDIPTSPEMIGVPNVYTAQVYRHATQLVARDPKCWEALEQLLKHRVVEIEASEINFPTSLEMAGIAVREKVGDDSVLKFASPLRERFIRQFYDNRRFGDLYARAGEWDKAFKRYDLLNPEEKMRPSGINDRADVEATVNALCASLYSGTAKSPDPLKAIESAKNLFLNGCWYVLGFREVTFWEWDEKQNELVLQNQPLNLFTPSDSLKNRIALLLSAPPLPDDILALQDPWNRYAIAAQIPTLRSSQRAAVVISDLEKRAIISREREGLARHLLQHFIKAYGHAVEVYKLQQRLKGRNKHVQIMNSVFNLLENYVPDVEGILTTTARGLKSLGYSRVMFSLVDREKKRIKGYLDLSNNPKVNIAQETDWPLREYRADIQPFVIHTKKPKCVPDASKEPLSNPKVAQDAGIRAFAIIPILNPTGEAIGTIHVEREDGAMPTEDEANDLRDFGRQLAIVIERTEPYLLVSALNKIPEPIIVADRNERPLYANSPAADLFGLKLGWQKPNQPSLRTAPGGEKCSQLLSESLQTGHRRVSHFESLGNRSDYHVAVLTDVVEDWRGDIAGALLRVQDFDYIQRVFEASQLVAESTDKLAALEGMLKAASETLRHKWGRMYVYEKRKDNGEERFVSKLSFPADWAYAKEFNNGEVILKRKGGPGQIDWKCIDEKTPLVFCWKEDLENGKQHITRHGLKAINVINPKQPSRIQKKPGDFWIDFPLMTPEEILGKMCLGCDEDLRPENFELLRLLSQEVVGLFDAFVKRARNDELVQRDVEETTRAMLVHNLFTHFGGFSPILTEYRLLANELEPLKELNRQFAKVLGDAMSIAKRAKERQGAIALKPAPVDLINLLENLLAPLPKRVWTLEYEERPIKANIDGDCFGTAILEMLQNSQEMISNPEQLRVSITVELIQPDEQPEEWVKLTYKDNGPGVPDQIRDRVFDENFTFRPGRRKGTGIGLYFVRRVIEAHGGFIFLGLPAQGAEFTMAVPKNSTINQKEESDVSYPDRRRH
ncbi:MAG TPA: ATP-binding protein [Pyrinomonadaceae bacterium]